MCMEMSVDNKDITMFNVYMPCDNRDNLDEYLHLLSNISTRIELDSPYVMMIGDLNANTTPQSDTLFGMELKRYCSEEELIISDLSMCDPRSFTFYSEAH